MTNIRECKQTKCCFLGTNDCPICEDCKCEPNMIDEDCDKCWNCENDQGIIRGSKRKPIKEKQGIIILTKQ